MNFRAASNSIRIGCDFTELAREELRFELVGSEGCSTSSPICSGETLARTAARAARKSSFIDAAGRRPASALSAHRARARAAARHAQAAGASRHSGRYQGFDAPHLLTVFRVTHWFEPLPPTARPYRESPPAAFVFDLTARLRCNSREVEASQLLSTLCVLGVFFAFRSALGQSAGSRHCRA